MSNLPTLINVPASIPMSEILEGLGKVGLTIQGKNTMQRVVRIPNFLLADTPVPEFLRKTKKSAPKAKKAKRASKK